MIIFSFIGGALTGWFGYDIFVSGDITTLTVTGFGIGVAISCLETCRILFYD